MTTEKQESAEEQAEEATSSTEGGTTRRRTTRRSTSKAAAGAAEGKPRRRRKAAAEPAAEEAAAAEAKPKRRRKKVAEPVAEEAAAVEPVAEKAAAAEAKPKRRRKKAAEPVAEEAAAEAPAAVQARPQPRLLERLRGEIAPVMISEFGYTSAMQVPRLSKIVLNIGMGEALLDSKALENASKELAAITGQRPVTTRAKKSIAGFKIRQGMAIGTSVTLRGRRMYEFMDRLVSSTLPRIRDFRGVSRKAFDGRGNYSLGIREQVIFPEIDYNTIDRIRGLQVVICTTAPTDSEGLRLLELIGVPFAQGEDVARVA